MAKEKSSCRVFEPDKNYKVSEAFNHSPTYPKWLVWNGNQIVSRHKTKREAKAAIPMVETTQNYET